MVVVVWWFVRDPEETGEGKAGGGASSSALLLRCGRARDERGAERLSRRAPRTESSSSSFFSGRCFVTPLGRNPRNMLAWPVL